MVPWVTVLCFLCYPLCLSLCCIPGLAILQRSKALALPGLKEIQSLIDDLKYLMGSSVFRWMTTYLFFSARS